MAVDAFKYDRQMPARVSRLSQMNLDGLECNNVNNGLKAAKERYDELKKRSTAYSDKLANLETRQKEFSDNKAKLLTWLDTTEEKMSAVKDEFNSADPVILQEQLERMKSLNTDAIAQGTQVNDTNSSRRLLTAMLREMASEPGQIQTVTELANDMSDRYTAICHQVSVQANTLQTALVKSQGVHEAMDGLLNWIQTTETNLQNQRPISLNRDNLTDQIQEIQVIDSDIHSHKRGIDSVKKKANELMKSCDLDTAKALEAKLGDIDIRYNTVRSMCQARSQDMKDVSQQLTEFETDLQNCNVVLASNIDLLESKNLTRLPSKEFLSSVQQIASETERKLDDMEKLKNKGQLLKEDSRTGEVATIRESLIDMQRNWSDLEMMLSQRQKEAAARLRQESEFERVKKEVTECLAALEIQADRFEPVAIEIDEVSQQIVHLKVNYSHFFRLYLVRE